MYRFLNGDLSNTVRLDVTEPSNCTISSSDNPLPPAACPGIIFQVLAYCKLDIGIKLRRISDKMQSYKSLEF